MLCSARELGLGDDHAGILILPPDTPLGVPYGEALGLDAETVYDLDVTPQPCRIASAISASPRSVAAHVGVPLAAPSASVTATAGAPTRQATVELVDGDRCPRFTTIVISGVRVGPSPDWMARRLAAAGMRSINNVVDVSNYVMLETEPAEPRLRPRHAGRRGFRVRLATDGETMVTLDGVERTLTGDDLLDLRRQRHAHRHRRHHGWARQRDQRRRPRRSRSRSPGSSRSASCAKTATRLGLRSEASAALRARCRSPRHDHGHRPVRRAAAAHVS